VGQQIDRRGDYVLDPSAAGHHTISIVLMERGLSQANQPRCVLHHESKDERAIAKSIRGELRSLK